MAAIPRRSPCRRQGPVTIPRGCAPCRDSHKSAQAEKTRIGVAWWQRPGWSCGHPGGSFPQVAGSPGVFARDPTASPENATCVSFATTDFVKDGRNGRPWAPEARGDAFLRGSRESRVNIDYTDILPGDDAPDEEAGPEKRLELAARRGGSFSSTRWRPTARRATSWCARLSRKTPSTARRSTPSSAGATSRASLSSASPCDCASACPSKRGRSPIACARERGQA